METAKAKHEEKNNLSREKNLLKVKYKIKI